MPRLSRFMQRLTRGPHSAHTWEWVSNFHAPASDADWPNWQVDQLQASLICDGFHLPLDLVRVVYGVKGIGRCILVTDAVHVANLPPGRYSLVGREIELLPSGQVVTADRQSMAGSALSMNRAVTVFEKFAGVPLGDALQAATANPGRLLHHDGVCTDLAPASQPT